MCIGVELSVCRYECQCFFFMFVLELRPLLQRESGSWWWELLALVRTSGGVFLHHDCSKGCSHARQGRLLVRCRQGGAGDLTGLAGASLVAFEARTVRGRLVFGPILFSVFQRLQRLLYWCYLILCYCMIRLSPYNNLWHTNTVWSRQCWCTQRHLVAFGNQPIYMGRGCKSPCSLSRFEQPALLYSRTNALKSLPCTF